MYSKSSARVTKRKAAPGPSSLIDDPSPTTNPVPGFGIKKTRANVGSGNTLKSGSSKIKLVTRNITFYTVSFHGYGSGDHFFQILRVWGLKESHVGVVWWCAGGGEGGPLAWWASEEKATEVSRLIFSTQALVVVILSAVLADNFSAIFLSTGGDNRTQPHLDPHLA
uniref:(California timema) hypothetical protein n=1 Tax=Timema californicum TaxID=61474 RepID=A0A7R9JD99_TIMCA|nr:unnamed protein product [Timema californicum]